MQSSLAEVHVLCQWWYMYISWYRLRIIVFLLSAKSCIWEAEHTTSSTFKWYFFIHNPLFWTCDRHFIHLSKMLYGENMFQIISNLSTLNCLILVQVKNSPLLRPTALNMRISVVTITTITTTCKSYNASKGAPLTVRQNYTRRLHQPGSSPMIMSYILDYLPRHYPYMWELLGSCRKFVSTILLLLIMRCMVLCTSIYQIIY